MPDCDLGDVGPREGQPIPYYWSPWWTLAPLLSWMGLLPLMLLKSNRAPAAWWIGAPLLLLLALLWGLESLIGGGGLLEPARPIILSVAALWLLGEPIAARRGWQRWGLAAVIYFVAAALFGYSMEDEVVSFFKLVWVPLPGLVILGALSGTARSVRGQPGRRFGLRLLPWCIGVMLGAGLVLLATGLLFSGIRLAWLPGLLVGVGLWSLVGGLVVWLLLLPFFLMASMVPLYDARMKKVFSL